MKTDIQNTIILIKTNKIDELRTIMLGMFETEDQFMQWFNRIKLTFKK
jgi:hypothetical protein